MYWQPAAHDVPLNALHVGRLFFEAGMTAPLPVGKSGQNEPETLTRRLLLKTGLRLSLAATLIRATSASATLCVDPEDLSGADYAFRKYVEYTEASSKPDKTCSGCQFFKAQVAHDSQGDCGSCQVVAGSINAHGYCKSWEARVEKR